MRRSVAMALAAFEAMQLQQEAVALASAGKGGSVKRMKAAKRAMRELKRARALPDDTDVPSPVDPQPD
jgi:hypothetical protein